MSQTGWVPLPGSEREALPTFEQAGSLDAAERIEVTLVTRRMAPLPTTADGALARISRDELRGRHGSDPADQALVTTVLGGLGAGIQVTAADPATRLITVTGTVGALAGVFGTELSRVTSPGSRGAAVTHRYRTGGLSIPAELDGVVVAVLGLDSRPQGWSQLRQASATAGVSYTPPQVAAMYQFPASADGTGQTVGIIELGGGFAASDLDSYFGGLGLTPPSVTAVGVAGGSNVPGQDPNGADMEVLLDIEVVGGVAPGAAQVVYFAPNTDQGFIAAVTAAVQATPTPAAVSISWGQSEDSWTAQSRTSLDDAIADGAAIGVTVCVAAGDNGSGDGVTTGDHVDFPASSPHALACGGTTLQGDPQAGTITSETVWADGSGGGATGGGVSDVFALPSWQATAGVPDDSAGTTGRGVPDVAGNADPDTGYQVLVDGTSTVVGGTSAVAPLWAGLTARLTQAAGHGFGLVQADLYTGVTPGTAVTGLRDITSGSNGAFSAGPGWDACTGLGSPDGTALLTRLTASPPSS
jgi:kumamolisin